MIELQYGPRFLKQAGALQKTQQEKLARLISLLVTNPFDPRLHTKHLKPPLEGTYSFRITRDWRVTFHFVDEKTLRLLEVKHRKDIYR